MFIVTYTGKAASYTVSGGHTFKKGSTKQLSLDVQSEKFLYEILRYNPEFDIQEIGVEPLKEKEEIQPLDLQPIPIENNDSMPTEEEVISDTDLFPLKTEKTEQPEPQQASSKRGKRR